MQKVRCRLGKIITLEQKRWKHVLSHPEMSRQQHRVKETLTDPDEVRESIRDKQVWLYYKLYDKTPVTTKYMLVIVRVLDGEGFIVTAFFTDKMKKGKQVWKKSL